MFINEQEFIFAANNPEQITSNTINALSCQNMATDPGLNSLSIAGLGF